MRVMRIGIKSVQELLTEFKDVAEALQRGEHVRPRRGVYFTSLEAARRFLTPKRMELIRLIREKRPRSIYELAKHAKRGFPTVFRDVELLNKHGLIRLSRRRGSPRRSVHPEVPYESINLSIPV